MLLCGHLDDAHLRVKVTVRVRVSVRVRVRVTVRVKVRVNVRVRVRVRDRVRVRVRAGLELSGAAYLPRCSCVCGALTSTLIRRSHVALM